MTEQPVTFDINNPRHHVIVAHPSRYNDEADTWYSVDGNEIRLYAKCTRHTERFSVGAIGADGEARHEHGGPVIKGQYGYLVPQPIVIAAHPQRRPQFIDVSDGDTVNVFCVAADGQAVQSLLFTVADDRYRHGGYPRLIPAGITKH